MSNIPNWVSGQGTVGRMVKGEAWGGMGVWVENWYLFLGFSRELAEEGAQQRAGPHQCGRDQ